MWARRLSYRLMMAGPLVLVTAIAINGRAGAPYQARAVFGPENHKRLLAYVGPVRAAEAIENASPSERAKDLDRAVQLWIGLADTKALLPVFPVEFDTSTQDTVLNDIRNAKLTLLAGLQAKTLAYDRAEDYDGEARALCDAVRIAAIDKYTELATVHQFGVMQARCLDRIGSLTGFLSPQVRTDVSDELAKTARDDGKLSQVVSHIRALHSESLLRNGIVTLPIEWAQSYEAMLDATNTPGPEALVKMRAAVDVKSSFDMAGIGAMARMALKTDSTYRDSMVAALRVLQSTK